MRERSEEWSLFSFRVQTRVVSVRKASTRMSHISRMCWSMSCGCRRRAGMSGGERGPPAWSRPAWPAWSIPAPPRGPRRGIRRASLVGVLTVPQAAGVLDDGVEHALVGPAHLVAEQAVEGQGRVQFQRRRRGRRAPRDVRAVDHRVVLVDRRDRRLAAQHQARHLRLRAGVPR